MNSNNQEFIDEQNNETQDFYQRSLDEQERLELKDNSQSRLNFNI